MPSPSGSGSVATSAMTAACGSSSINRDSFVVVGRRSHRQVLQLAAIEADQVCSSSVSGSPRSSFSAIAEGAASCDRRRRLLRSCSSAGRGWPGLQVIAVSASSRA
jgi:hypothetical protein